MTTWTPEQQREHRAAWVAALRSGKYQQTTGTLHDDHGYCCLGVACDISKAGAWAGDPAGWNSNYYVIGEEVDDTLLPTPVRDWLGLANNDGATPDGKINLWRLNDDGKTFAEIADIIEAEPEGLLADEAKAA